MCAACPTERMASTVDVLGLVLSMGQLVLLVLLRELQSDRVTRPGI